jgi:DNA-binding NtrC family response regulator
MNLLLVHRDPGIIDILRRAAQFPGIEQIVVADSVGAAVRPTGATIDAIVFDLGMERFDGMRVERALRQANPTALLVAIGPPVPGSAAFRLASLGVTAFLDLPLVEERVRACLRALGQPTDLLIHAAKVEVGVRDLKQSQRVVRLSMCEEALSRTHGSRRAAARLLGVDRRAVQKIAEDLVDEGRLSAVSADVAAPTATPATASPAVDAAASGPARTKRRTEPSAR